MRYDHLFPAYPDLLVKGKVNHRAIQRQEHMAKALKKKPLPRSGMSKVTPR